MDANLPIDELQKLSAAGNCVAAEMLSLLNRDYPYSAEGFKLAIAAGYNSADAMYSAAVSKALPLQLRSRPAVGLPMRRAGSGLNSLLDQAGVVGQIWPGTIGGIPNRPGPLSSMALLGLLGAAGGRLAGKGFGVLHGARNSRAENTLTVLGGMAGMLPGAFMASANIAAGKPAFTGDVFSLPPRHFFDKLNADKFGLDKTCEVIPVEQLQEMIWNDPWVANRLPLSLTAATSSLVEGAQRTASPDRSLPFVTPMDVARMAVGLGSGYSSGLIVGKALGSLFGVSDASQKVLRQSGAAAGLIKSIVPLAYGM